MIRALFVGVARCLFHMAVLALVVAALLLYGAYRLLRSAVARGKGRPVQAAAFVLIGDVLELAKALGEKRDNLTPR